MYTDNRTILLNSKYAQYKNGTFKSNVVFPFKGIIKDEENIIQKYITVLDAQIPCSFYIINSTNKVLTVVLGANTYTLNLTLGNYNANSLITELISKIATIPTLTATIVINKSTGKLTFTCSSSVTLVYTTSTIGTVLGLTANLTGTSITLQQPLNLLGVKLLNIKSTALSVTAFTSENFGNSSILLSIPNNEASFNMISYTNQNSLNNAVLFADIVDVIDIQILDESGNFIDFNGIDWTMNLGISIERERTVKFEHNLLTAIQSLTPQLQSITNDLIKEKPDADLQLLES